MFALDYNRAYDIFFTEPMFDLARKWALFDGREMVSVLTTTPLIFGWGRAIGVAGVATRQERRREGYAAMLLERVLKESVKRGETGALLFAQDLALYEKAGFEPLDRVIRAPIAIEAIPDDLGEPMETEEVKAIYKRWSNGHEDRLRRDDRRWDYWCWHNRFCSAFGSGYLCEESGALREAIYDKPVSSLPLPEGTEWFGTTFMADQLEIPVRDAKVELYLMGHNVPGVPQLFMTDQF